MGKVSPAALARYAFPSGSMGPKVEAAVNFVPSTGKRTLIGSIDQIDAMPQVAQAPKCAPTERTSCSRQHGTRQIH